MFVLACTLSVLASAQESPLQLVVLGSDSVWENRPLWPTLCSGTGLEIPCNSKDIPPNSDASLVRVTARITQRGRTSEYLLICTRGRFRKCEELKAGRYAARWDGKRLLVQARDRKDRMVTYRFEVKGERDLE